VVCTSSFFFKERDDMGHSALAFVRQEALDTRFRTFPVGVAEL
jgi:hypothetical protein